MKNLYKTLKVSALLALVSFLVSGCIGGEIKDLSQVSSSDVLLVGQIDIVPKIQPQEIITGATCIGCGNISKMFILKIADKYYPLQGDDAISMKDSVHVTTEQDFYITENRNKPINVLGGWFYTRLDNSVHATMLYSLGDGIKINYPKNAKAVYIGTIKFKRDEFFHLKDIKVSQADFKNAQKRFQKKFHSHWKLVKAKLTSAK